MHHSRQSHGICQLDRFVYVCSGKTKNNIYTKSIERLDTANNRWEQLADCNFESVLSLLVPLNDRYIIKLGGIRSNDIQCDSVERYDAFTDTWTVL